MGQRLQFDQDDQTPKSQPEKEHELYAKECHESVETVGKSWFRAMEKKKAYALKAFNFFMIWKNDRCAALSFAVGSNPLALGEISGQIRSNLQKLLPDSGVG